MWKIIHLNSGHTLVTEDNIDLTKPVITANVLDRETSIALHAIHGEDRLEELAGIEVELASLG